MYKIRTAKFEDMGFLISMASKEGWNPGIYDAEAFFAADNNGFFIGELNGVPISCISAVKYSDYGFIGFYVVKEEFRAKGFGIKNWEHAMNYLGNINIGLDGVVAQTENYQKFGFKLAHSNARYSGKLNITTANKKNIIKANEADFEKLCEYDKEHFGASRNNFIGKWINLNESFSFCYVENQNIKGFGACRKTQNGFKIGPLFAENENIAEAIFLNLVSEIGDSEFYLDINESFKPAVEFANKYQMTKVFETRRMYTKGPTKAKWDEVWGITSFELG